jgi:ubiquinone/menaquinone biosynthesis C-methylase UbiE
MNTINQESISTRDFYEKAYSQQGLAAQRRYPNEEFLRFLGRNFSHLTKEEKQKVSLLEVGSGSGANLWVPAREGFQTYGLDISKEGNELCKEVLALWGTKPKELLVSSMESIPLEDNSLDVVIDIFSSNCLNTKEFKQYLNQVSRVLKKGGIYFSYTPSKNSEAFINFEPAKKMDENTLNGIYRETSPFYGNKYNFRFITPDEYRIEMEERGFTVPYLETIGRTYRSGQEYFEFVTIEARKL